MHMFVCLCATTMTAITCLSMFFVTKMEDLYVQHNVFRHLLSLALLLTIVMFLEQKRSNINRCVLMYRVK